MARNLSSTTANRFPNLLAAFVLWAACSGGSEAQVRQFYTDFEDGLPAGTQVRSNAVWSATGGAGGGGVLKLTEALENQVGSFVVEDFTGGIEIEQFWARFLVRIGGGT